MIGFTKNWLLACLAVACMWWGQAIAEPKHLLILAYHDVVPTNEKVTEPFSVNAHQMMEHIEWLRTHGYRFVSVRDVLDDRAGSRSLPDKSVLLTFDDGYQSVFTQVFPILKLYQAPAVISLVGRWMETGEIPLEDGSSTAPALNWDQVREMVASGLVEVASHSHDAHRGLPGNPQGNAQPALTTHQWRQSGYETHTAYLDRVSADLSNSRRLIRDQLGAAPRIITWPFGSHSPLLHRIAKDHGMHLGLTLDDGLNTADSPLAALRRVLVTHDTYVGNLAQRLHEAAKWPEGRTATTRTIHVDLDYIYDANTAQQERNLDLLVERVRAMGANQIYLQAFADPDGDGVADAVYFPNRHLPVRAELFNRAAWQLQTRARVKVYAWMPVLAFQPPPEHPLRSALVLSAHPSGIPNVQGYARLNPHYASAQQWIKDIYEDLARHARFQGLLFHDDATLSDFEDDSNAGRLARVKAGLPADVHTVRRSAEQLAKWTTLKTGLIDQFTLDLASLVRQYQPNLRTARNLYARVVLDPASTEWFAQSFESALRHYDEVAVMAMPYLEQAANPEAWMTSLLQRVAHTPQAMEKTVFELQTRNWRTKQAIPTAELAAAVQKLHTLGARHIAYYPDDPYLDHPQLRAFRRTFSLQTTPAP